MIFLSIHPIFFFLSTTENYVILSKLKRRKFLPPQQYKENNQCICELEHEGSDCDCVSFEIIDVEGRVIIFKTFTKFSGTSIHPHSGRIVGLNFCYPPIYYLNLYFIKIFCFK